MDDWQLIRRYLNEGSESAFAELVRRYVDLVYSVAWRKLGNAHDAEEVAQRVFCQLARKARGLSANTNITGWLHQAACFESLHHLRSERRRRDRENEVARMNLSSQETETLWQQIAPHLDAALLQIDENDRTILLKRFFQRQSLKEVGGALGVTEDAARMRVNRALEKLREILAGGGVASSVAALAGILPERAVQAAPVIVVQHIQGAVLAAIQSVGAVSLGAKALALITGSKAAIALISALLLAVAAVFALRFHQSPVSAGLADPISKIADTAIGPVLDVSPEGITTLLADSKSDQSDLASLIAQLRKVLREKQGEREDGTRDDDRVTAAIKAFGPDIPAAIPVLIEGLQDPVASVKSASMTGFLRVRPYESVAMPPLLALARDESQPWITRNCAVESLRCLASPRDEGAAVVAGAVPELIAILKSDCITLKGTVCLTLDTLGRSGYARESIPELVNLLAYTASIDVVRIARESGDWALLPRAVGERMENDEASLRRDMEQLSGKVRRHAVEALGSFGADAREAVPQLCEFLQKNSEAELKIKSIQVLKTIGPDAAAAVPLLREQLSDKREKLRTTAALALWSIAREANGTSEVLAEALYPYLGDDKYFYEAQLKTLGEMGAAGAVAIPNLIKLCKHSMPEVRKSALATLYLIDPYVAATVPPE